jgi:hypothetical protein
MSRARVGVGVCVRFVVVVCVVGVCFGGLGAGSVFGAVAGPAWSVHSFAIPSVFTTAENVECPGTITNQFPLCDAFQVTATNVGSVAAQPGGAIVVGDVVPAGVSVVQVRLVWPALGKLLGLQHPKIEDLFATLKAFGFCTLTPLRCAIPAGAVAPDEAIEMTVFVTVNEPVLASSLTNEVFAGGGGAAEVREPVSNGVGGLPPGFGAASVSAAATGLDGGLDSEAGAHPYEFSTRVDFNNEFRVRPDATFGPTSIEDPRDVVVDLPAGLLGTALSTKTCSFAELSSHVEGGVGGCPPDTVIGHIFTEPVSGASIEGPIYNMVAEHGHAAEFGFVDLLAGPHILYANVVSTPSGYVLRTTAPELPQVPLTDVVATFYGDPAVRDAETICGSGSGSTEVACREALEESQTPTFTNPDECSGQPLSTVVYMDSWQHPGARNADGSPDVTGAGWVSAQTPTFPEGVTGCNLLRFTPAFSAQPETEVPAAADSPAGLNVDMRIAQSEAPSTLGAPPLRDAVVTLPVGVTVDPSSAGGLQACSEAEIGYTGYNAASETQEFTDAAPACPEASKIGTVELSTPLLASVLHGSVYLATQTENPFGSLLAGYIVVNDPDTGVVVKIAGELKTNPVTGQITGVFRNNPQFPFSELKLHFKGGSRGVLATPEACGTYTTTSQLTPWSAPDTGPPAELADSFQVSSGCVSGFAPSFTAGTTNTQAGAYTPFVMSFSRSDTDQELSGLQVTLPPGLLAKIAGVPLCTEAQLAAAAANPSGASETANPSCPAASQIGTVQAGAGPGATPYFVSGKAYLTGPYKNGPYGIAVIVPAVAGPFDLGNVVIRSALHIDPTDAHVTVISDPFPTFINNTGIPVRLRRVDVTIERPDFTFNPTSCAPMSITASLSSTGGVTAGGSSRFQASGCGELPFKPSFAASTSGVTSKLDGASLTVNISQKPGEANIHKVDVQLPYALPSRLTTLQKACLEAQFNTNPAGCPAGSNIGTATATTPDLAAPLTGPAYLVSHGGAAFPDVEFVLQGAGIMIILDGKTDIKKGITYSNFETVPDAPITSFQTSFPEGPHSALSANRNLCATTTQTTTKHVTRRVHGHLKHLTIKTKKTVLQPLLMPTTITAQNGATIKQTTTITTTGCPKPKTTTSKPKHK